MKYVTLGIIACLLVPLWYFKSSLDNANSRIKDLKVELVETKQELENTKNLLSFEQTTTQNQLAELEKIKNLPPVERTVIEYKTLVKEVPAEIVVQTANEDTNEIIMDIVRSATDFGLYN